MSYHVCNRGSRKGVLFASPDEYTAFERLLGCARGRYDMRIVAYCLMVNHWHLLLWPREDGDVPRFLHWVTGTHGGRVRRETQTSGEGAVYQSRYRALGVLDGMHFLRVCRYIERNPVRARLVGRAEQWPWSSAAQRAGGDAVLPMDDGPLPLASNWLSIVNRERDLCESDLLLAHRPSAPRPSAPRPSPRRPPPDPAP